MTDQRYNGWTNYETWNVSLWLDNDEGSYTYVRERADELKAEAVAARDENESVDDPTYELAEWLEEFVEETTPDLGASMFADLLGAALSEVDWREIAESVLSES
jgi:hypothetical protein